MSFSELPVADLVGIISGLLLTLCIFSYILGDNFLFRLAISIFIGVAAGFAVVITLYNVIIPQLVLPLFNDSSSRLFYNFIPLLLSALLFLKISPRLSRLGNPSMAFLVGVGVAVAIGGAIRGTIIPQVGAAINSFGDAQTHTPLISGWWRLVEGGVLLIGTVSSLAYFHFGTRQRMGQPAKRLESIEWTAWLGQIFIAIALAALVAGVFSASLTAFVERVSFIWNFLSGLL